MLSRVRRYEVDASLARSEKAGKSREEERFAKPHRWLGCRLESVGVEVDHTQVATFLVASHSIRGPWLGCIARLIVRKLLEWLVDANCGAQAHIKARDHHRRCETMRNPLETRGQLEFLQLLTLTASLRSRCKTTHVKTLAAEPRQRILPTNQQHVSGLEEP